MTEKLYATAEKTYKKAVKLDPKTALFRKNMGTAMLAEHKYKKGWAEYQAALELDPNIFSHNSNVRVENCTVQAVRRWEFPKPLGGGIVIVSYPFVLTPAGSGE